MLNITFFCIFAHISTNILVRFVVDGRINVKKINY